MTKIETKMFKTKKKKKAEKFKTHGNDTPKEKEDAKN